MGAGKMYVFSVPNDYRDFSDHLVEICNSKISPEVILNTLEEISNISKVILL